MLGSMSRLRKFKSLSPLNTPHTSPDSSPKISKRKFGKCSTKVIKPDQQLWRPHTNTNKSQKQPEQASTGIEVDEMELKRIQDLFPFDNLLLSHKDPFTQKRSLPKHWKANTTTMKLHRVLSGKSKNSPTERHKKYRMKSGFETVKSESKFFRRFIMEGCVTITFGMQSQQRFLLLFTDILLVAKARSSSVYKLKERIRICELWLGDCIEEVCEVTLSQDTSFVIGWPITNVAVSFNNPQLRNTWYSKLKQLILEAKSVETKSTLINVSVGTCSLHEQQCKQVKVHSNETARDCIKKILNIFYLNEAKCHDYQLWVKTKFEPAPYPLIGHEFPFAIKMNCMWSMFNNSENTSDKCVFILRSVIKSPLPIKELPTDLSKKGKCKRKLIMSRVFRRSSSKPESLGTSTNGHLFGRSLSLLCHNNQLPRPILEIIIQLVRKGPNTHGIFRKSANSKACRELRDKLDSLQPCNLENYNILLLTSVLKDFLRSLPDCVMQCSLHDDWLDVVKLLPNARLNRIHKLLRQLPPANFVLLEYIICVLWHIAQKSQENQMTAANLAVCIGPSLLWSTRNVVTPENSKKLPSLIEFLITKCPVIFGKEIIYLCDAQEQKDRNHQDSGAEESDSCGLLREDSSLDSLEKILLGEGEVSPKLPNKAKISLSNLSRDSGLTMSDTQLYTPEEDQDKQVPASRHFVREGLQTKKTLSSIYKSDSPRSRMPIYERTVSACEMPKNLNSQTITRSQSSQFTQKEDKTQSQTLNPPKKIAGTRKETHKRRLARPRQWYNPRTPWDPDDISPVSTLRKSSSEENLLQGYNTNSNVEREQRASNFVAGSDYQSSRMFRSVSVYHLLSPGGEGFGGEFALWHRTQSTPHLDDGNHDSSTVSDNDSTPHVSRSNSRGKEERNSSPRNVKDDDEIGFSYLPTYEETMNRRSFLRKPVKNYMEAPAWTNVEKKGDELGGGDNDIYFAAPVRVNVADDSLPPLPPKPKQKPRWHSNSSNSNNCHVNSINSNTASGKVLRVTQQRPNWEKIGGVKSGVTSQEPQISRVHVNRPQFRCADESVYCQHSHVTKLQVNGVFSDDKHNANHNRQVNSNNGTTAKIVLTVKGTKNPLHFSATTTTFSEESYV